MLLKLSNNKHDVITAVCIRSVNNTECFFVSTEVVFDVLTEEAITYYIEKYEPYDKAGGYGIQEWIGLIGVKEINGSYFNVVGLPVNEIYKHLNNIQS